MGLSQNTALIIVLVVAFLWGSWFQVVKHTGEYPIYVFLSWLYIFSLIIVWGTIAATHDYMIPNGIFHEIASDIPRAVLVFGCGAVYAIGMQIQLSVVSRVGLILSSSITSTCSIISGTIISSVIGGISESSSLLLIILAAILLITGTIVCQVSGVMRDKDSPKNEKDDRKEGVGSQKKNIFLLLITSAVMIPFYSVASSIGLSTDLRPQGFSPLTCMGILCIGALVGTSVYTGYWLTKEKKWNRVLHPQKGLPLILAMSCIAAFCHFGGNILHSVAAPVVSVVIATGIGYSNGMWTYLWGLLYGEFSGAKRRTVFVLGGGMSLYVIGVLILTFNI